jgi:hypothetical protein
MAILKDKPIEESECFLTSVLELREEIQKAQHHGMIFSSTNAAIFYPDARHRPYQNRPRSSVRRDSRSKPVLVAHPARQAAISS